MPERPSCFGDPDTYDQTDAECRFKCPARFDCRMVVERKSGASYRPAAVASRVPVKADVRPQTGHAIQFHPQEPKSRRYAAEVLSGVLRAWGLETSRFFDQYRFDYVPPTFEASCPNCRRAAGEADKFCRGCGYELVAIRE